MLVSLVSLVVDQWRVGISRLSHVYMYNVHVLHSRLHEVILLLFVLLVGYSSSPYCCSDGRCSADAPLARESGDILLVLILQRASRPFPEEGRWELVRT